MRSRLLRHLAVGAGLMRTGTGVAGLAGRIAIMKRTALLRVWLVRVNWYLRSAILRGRCSLRGQCIVALVGVWMAILAAGRLGHVRHNLHATRNDARGTPATCCIG